MIKSKMLKTHSNAIILICLFFIFSSSFGQKNNELKTAENHLKNSLKLAFSNKLDSVHFLVKKARKTFLKYNDWQNYVTTFRAQGFFYIKQKKWNDARTIFEEGVKFAKLKLTKNNVLTPILLQKLGIQYYYIGEVDLAINCYKEALVYYELQKKPIENKKYQALFSNLAHAYMKKHDIKNALDFEEKSFNLNLKKNAKKSYLAINYARQGKLNYEIGNYYKAKKAAAKAFEFYQELGEKNLMLDCYYDLGSIERKQGNFDEALRILNEALLIPPQKNNERATYKKLASVLVAIGNVYSDLKQYEKANTYFQKAIYTHRHIYHNWIRLHTGDNYINLQEFDSALHHYQVGIVDITKKFEDLDINKNPKIEDAKHLFKLLQFTQRKGFALNQLYKDNKQLNTLVNSHNTNLLAIDVIDSILVDNKSNYSKFVFSELISKTYEQSIQSSLALYKETGDEKYRLKAFEITEKSKAGVLMSDLKSIDAKQFGNIPDSLLEQEKEIRINHSYYTSRLNAELAKKEKQDSSLIDETKDELFSLNRKKEDLEALLEKKYPKYHTLKYNNSQPTISELQQSLDPQTSLIEYFVGDSTIYAFTITKDNFQIHELSSIDSLEKKVKSLPELLREKDKAGFSDKAYTLYQKLIEPLNIKTPNLNIIPDGALWQLNFDLLLSQKAEKLDYRKFQYLIKDYTISYAYSAKLLQQDIGYRIKPKKKEVLAFSYNNPDDISVGNFIAMRGFRDNNLGDLPGTRKEIKAVSSVFDGAYYYGSYANEKNFKTEAKDYSILHLALHGVIDHENPMNSKLYFTQNKDTLEDNYLHAFELYNLELNAELAVLSACQTGSGKLIKGEGVMSLGRAFTYAGCKSLLLSQWDVSDAFTPALMKDFYQNLMDGKTKAASLREAKLAYLAQADNLTSNPYYWAPLVQLGDNKPLKQDSYWPWVLGATATLLLVLGLIVFIKRRSKNI